MKKEEFLKLRIGDIVKWGYDHDYYALLIQKLDIKPSEYHIPILQAIVLYYAGPDARHWGNGTVINLTERDHRSMSKVA